jgi:hypothetical protein
MLLRGGIVYLPAARTVAISDDPRALLLVLEGLQARCRCLWDTNGAPAGYLFQLIVERRV